MDKRTRTKTIINHKSRYGRMISLWLGMGRLKTQKSETQDSVALCKRCACDHRVGLTQRRCKASGVHWGWFTFKYLIKSNNFYIFITSLEKTIVVQPWFYTQANHKSPTVCHLWKKSPNRELSCSKIHVENTRITTVDCMSDVIVVIIYGLLYFSRDFHVAKTSVRHPPAYMDGCISTTHIAQIIIVVARLFDIYSCAVNFLDYIHIYASFLAGKL
jgi:hypothetical protein